MSLLAIIGALAPVLISIFKGLFGTDKPLVNTTADAGVPIPDAVRRRMW